MRYRPQEVQSTCFRSYNHIYLVHYTVDVFFVDYCSSHHLFFFSMGQARCKFSEQFDEMAKTMSRAMKDEIALRAEQERQRRSEWEVRASRI